MESVKRTSALNSVLGWGRRTPEGCSLHRVSKITYVIYGYVHSLGEVRLHSYAVWSLMTFGIYVRHGFKKMNKYILKAEESFGGQSNCWLRWDSHLHLGELGQ